jgi:hypothetical protein
MRCIAPRCWESLPLCLKYQKAVGVFQGRSAGLSLRQVPAIALSGTGAASIISASWRSLEFHEGFPHMMAKKIPREAKRSASSFRIDEAC